MSEPERPPSGLVAGKYEVMRLIGRGGMGSVWEGRHASLGTKVAIKFIDKEHAASDEARARFATEARAAATIETKHAIRIFDHGMTDEGRPYIVMEMLVGEALDARIERLGRVSLVETARVLGQVCRALQRAHDAGIIHRDLKPENIFLVREPDDDEESAKVLDFGIAKIMGPAGDPTSSTKTGAVLGTPYYMSPEQARGLKTLDGRSDLWSLGVIAYRCVTGQLPFEGQSIGDLLVKICTSPPPQPSLAAPGLPPSFDAWFARALAREPADRFASATELGEALAVAAGVSVSRGSSSAGGLTASPPPARSTRGVLAVALATALIGALVGVVAFVTLTSGRRTAAAEHASAPAATGTGTLVVATPGASASASPTPGTGSDIAARGVAGGTAASSTPASSARQPPRSVPSPARPASAPQVPARAAKLPPASADPGY